MKLEFKRSSNGRFAILVNDRVQFESYSLTRDQMTKLQSVIDWVQCESFDEGRSCQQERALTNATDSSKASTVSLPQSPSAKTPQDSLLGQDRLERKTVGV